MQDESVQVFYSFNFGKKSGFTFSPIELGQNPLISSLNLGSSQIVPIKFVTFPLDKFKIVLRVENIGDMFDTDNTLQVSYVKLYDLANYLWAQSNENAALKGINIKETTLSGNQNYEEGQAARSKWKTEDDSNQGPAQPADKANWEIALQQQRIRQFTVEFVPLTQTFLQ